MEVTEVNDRYVWTAEECGAAWGAEVIPHIEGEQLGCVLLWAQDVDRQAVCVSFDQWDQIVAAVAEARKAGGR
jgi:hypothetical protein